jgi:hypothetical protein
MADSEFRSVPGFDTFFVSEDGRLRNSIGHLMAERQNDRTGYVSFSVRHSGRVRTLLAHRAVALAWIGMPPEGRPCVAHLDGDKKNNHRSNLAWVSYKENETHKEAHGRRNRGEQMPAHKLTEIDIIRIRRLHGFGVSKRSLSRAFDISTPVTRQIINGSAWSHVPFEKPTAAIRAAGEK